MTRALLLIAAVTLVLACSAHDQTGGDGGVTLDALMKLDTTATRHGPSTAIDSGTHDGTGTTDSLDAGDGSAIDSASARDGGSKKDSAVAHDAEPTIDALDAAAVNEGDSGCVSGTPSARCVVAAGPTALFGTLAVDDHNIYFASGASGPVYWATDLMRIPRAGGEAVTLVSASDVYGVASIVSDGNDVYWTTETPNIGVVLSVPMNGGAVTTVSTSSAPPYCIALDAENVYWSSQAVGVFKAPKTGGSPIALTPETYRGGADGIAVDATSVYWMAYDPAALMKVSKAGGAPVTLLGAAGRAGGGCRQLAAVNDTVFVGYSPSWDGGPGAAQIVTVPIGGTGTPSVFIADNVYPGNPLLVASSTSLFWEGYGTAIEINQTPLLGGTTTPLAAPAANAVEDMAVASDGTLYWTTDNQVQSLEP